MPGEFLSPSPGHGPVRVVEAAVARTADGGYLVLVNTRSGERLLPAKVMTMSAAPYRDTDTIRSAGANVNPSEGSLALVLFSSFGEPYIIGFVRPDNGYDRRQGREPLHRGDISLTHPSGSRVEAVSGTATLAGGAASRIDATSDDLVQIACHDYDAKTAVGGFSQKLDRDTLRGKLVIEGRTGAAAQDPGGRLEMGSNDDDSVVKLSATTGGTSSLSMNREGSVRLQTDKEATTVARGDIRMSGKKIYLNCGGTAFTQGPSIGNVVKPSSFTAAPGMPVPKVKLQSMATPPLALPAPDPATSVPSLVPIKSTLAKVEDSEKQA